MKRRTIYIIICLGIFVIGLTFYLFYVWMTKAYDQQEKKFSQSVQVALIEVVKKISDKNDNELPQVNPVKKISPDYYVVDIEKDIDCCVLEFYLTNEFEKMGIQTDFEYAIYDCSSDIMVYGNYISFKSNYKHVKSTEVFNKHEGLVYYFVVRFPEYTSYTMSSIKFLSGFSILSILFLVFMAYTIFIILYQIRFSELQKDFINNMTHEFKTPISSISLATDRIIAFADKSESILKYSDIIRDQNKKLNTIVERVLQIAVTEKKSFKLFKKTIEPDGFIKQIVLDTREKLNGGNVSFDSGLNGTKIEADEIHFLNLFYTLIDNSIKYSGKSPDISIKTENFSNSSVLISISDKGTGIEKKYHKKIFQKFFRVPTGDVHNIKGYGLGLYYVKKICKEHRWKLLFESEKGAGTTIKLLIKKSRHDKKL